MLGVTDRGAKLWVDCRPVQSSTGDMESQLRQRGQYNTQNGQLSIARPSSDRRRSSYSSPVRSMQYYNYSFFAEVSVDDQVDLQWMVLSCDPNRAAKQTCDEIPVSFDPFSRRFQLTFNFTGLRSRSCRARTHRRSAAMSSLPRWTRHEWNRCNKNPHNTFSQSWIDTFSISAIGTPWAKRRKGFSSENSSDDTFTYLCQSINMIFHFFVLRVQQVQWDCLDWKDSKVKKWKIKGETKIKFE